MVVAVAVVLVVVLVVSATQVLHMPLHIDFSSVPKTGSSQNSNENNGESHATGSATPLHINRALVVVGGVVAVV